MLLLVVVMMMVVWSRKGGGGGGRGGLIIVRLFTLVSLVRSLSSNIDLKLFRGLSFSDFFSVFILWRTRAGRRVKRGGERERERKKNVGGVRDEGGANKIFVFAAHIFFIFLLKCAQFTLVVSLIEFLT